MDHVISRNRMIDIVRREVVDYADVVGMNAEFYFVENPHQQVFAVIAIPHNRQSCGIVVLAVEIDGDKVNFERDTSDRPLFETLL